MYCPRLTDRVAQYVCHCGLCQRYKNTGRGIAHVAPALTSLGTPWKEIAIDGIGPWKVQLPPPHNTVIFNAFTIIYTTTGVLEIIWSVQINPAGQQAVEALNNVWLSRYLKPARCIFDQGKCFISAEFNRFLVNLDIKPVSCTVANPQTNAILERSHDTIKTSM